MTLDKREAIREARTRTRLGYPTTVAPVYRHVEPCLWSDGVFTPKHECTCGRRELVGYSLVLQPSGTRGTR